MTLPPALARLRSPVGAHRRGLKSIVYGADKTGKSKFAADHPGPLFVLACGDPGIEPYLDKGRGDECLNINLKAEYGEAIEFMVSDAAAKYKSFVIDPANLLWEDWSDQWAAQLNIDEIKGQHWRTVKGPWRAAIRKLMMVPQHVCWTAWLKDVLYAADPNSPPGIESRVRIVEQDAPQLEKTLKYAPDLIFKTDVERDRKNRPTNMHTVTFYGGRRPRSVPPSELYTGQTWRFDEKNPVNVWDAIVGPLYERWTDGAVDVLGVDPEEMQHEMMALQEAEQNELLGHLLSIIEKQEDLRHYSMTVFPAEISPGFGRLTVERQALVRAAHEKKKVELAK